MYTPLQEEILKTLSFMEPMSLEFILLDFDDDFLKANPDINTEQLLTELKQLKKMKKISSQKKDGQVFWLKVYPKRPWYKRLFT